MNPPFPRFIRICGLAVVLSACAAQPSPRAVVSASEAALSAAGRTIIACYSVPDCLRVAPKDKIRAQFMTAYRALTAAQAVADAGATPSMVAATAALTELEATVATLPTGGI